MARNIVVATKSRTVTSAVLRMAIRNGRGGEGMTLETDVRNNCYLIRITKEEVHTITNRAYENTHKYGVDVDVLMAKELSERILSILHKESVQSYGFREKKEVSE